jgi:hypothetical protein
VVRILAESEAARTTPGVGPADLRAWRDWITESNAIILGDRPPGAPTVRLPPRPPLPPQPEDPVADGLTRIARQLEMIAGAMPRLDG